MKLSRWLGLGAVVLALARPAPAAAQLTSTNYVCNGALSSGAGGWTTSASFGLISAVETPNVPQRSSTTNFDVTSGFLSTIFATLDTVTYSTTALRYKLIAVPLNLKPRSPTAVFDELGSYDNHIWRFGRFNPPTNAYLEAPTVLDSVVIGAGYWLITESSQSNLRAIGLPAPEQLFLSFNLDPGWNQMGNAFPFPVDLLTMFVRSGITTFAVTNPSNTFTEQTIKTFNSTTGVYSDASFVNGREGFWIKNITANPITLLLVRRGSTSGVPAPNLQADETRSEPTSRAGWQSPAFTRPEGSQWAVSLAAHQGDRVSEPMILGAAPVPAEGWNGFCFSAPPAPPGLEMLTLSVPRKDWGRASGDYTRMFQPAADHMSWRFELKGAQAPGEVALDLATASLPAGTELRLTDEATGEVTAVSAGRTITLATYAGGRSYRLDAFGGGSIPPEVGASVTTMQNAYPNPFRDDTGIAFTLARAGDVRLEIYDPQGRLVRTLERRGLGAGEHVLVWDGRDASGRSVGSGVYMTRWLAGGLRGNGRLVRIE